MNAPRLETALVTVVTGVVALAALLWLARTVGAIFAGIVAALERI